MHRPVDSNLLQTSSEADSNIDMSLKLAFSTATVACGGPAMLKDYSVLHSFGPVDGSMQVLPGVFLGGRDGLIHAVRANQLDPRDVLFLKGHTEWEPGQVEREISNGMWYVASVAPSQILRYAGSPGSFGIDLWTDILACMVEKCAKVVTH
jgi:putative transcriptional regulator